jgi:hypothetical protein
MTPEHRSDPLDDLTDQLLECGAVLSQIISHMVRSEAAGRSAPDAAPIPDVVRALVRDVISGLGNKHSSAEISAASAIVAEASDRIAGDIFIVSPDAN